ncbi:hypothetical protein HCN44_003241 [Aphidius gifuensis]|uniref:WD repeat-containing protein 19 n=1 Tax=Aphidius gifuensis TaxID=684658 RepID=A0A835CK53_APHGI|nr:WD repeat-containing protein 19 [Aphidius gifuensis]KAF7987479.1 hypothetical protein HCN44_003241 [Aphidius gifuensis]
MSSDKILYKLDHPHGPGSVFLCWRPGNSTHLATTGCDGVVSIYDRQGENQDRIQLSGICTGFGWDTDGDVLAIITHNSSIITLWDAATGKKSQVDAGVRDGLTCMTWSKNSCLLAVGTQKGHLSIYDHMNSRRIPILGKHKKKITCGEWSNEGLLALAGDDKLLTISSSDGDTCCEIPLQGDPQDLQFSETKKSNRINGDNTISLIINKTRLYLYNLKNPDNPIDIGFQKSYGPIVTYKWYGDCYIIIGFEAGYLLLISTHIKEAGQELMQIKNHRDSLNDLSLNKIHNKIATCGDNTLKIHDIKNLQDTEKIISVIGEAGVSSVTWSDDGTMLAAVTHSGNINIYLTKIPKLISVCNNNICILSSLNEAIVYFYTNDDDDNTNSVNRDKDDDDVDGTSTKFESRIINTIIEPSVLAVGPMHVVVGLNNRALYWNINNINKQSSPIERDYLSTIDSIKLNDIYSSVLFDGKLQLHTITTNKELSNTSKDTKLFNEQNTMNNNTNTKITCHVLTNNFLIYATNNGKIKYFYIDTFNYSNEYLHKIGIKYIYQDINGTYICFIDDNNDVYLYDPINDMTIMINDCPNDIQGIIWNQNIYDKTLFCIYNKQAIVTYNFIKYHIDGAKIINICETKLPTDTTPILMYNGQLTLGIPGGKLMEITLSSHEDVGNIVDNQRILEIFDNQLKCKKYHETWITCEILNDNDCWNKFGKYCLENLDIDMAIKIYCHIKNISMVWALKKIQYIEDINLLSGHVCTLLENYNKAEVFFLQSNEPIEALYLRRDLMQWEQALIIAEKLKPDEIPLISKEYAQQLEFIGNYPKALVNYERALTNNNNENENSNHRVQCLCGIARTSIRCGDSRRGMNIAIDNDTPRSVKKECAEIFEQMKQFNEAGILYEKSEYYDKAASAYIKLKNWQKVGKLIKNITSPIINIQYAKAKEIDGNYEEAELAYETAKDYDNIIRLNLNYLNNPSKSVEIVQKTNSIEGAKMVASYFQKLNDYNSAIKFLILSNCHDEAFKLANQHGKMELYGNILIDTLLNNNNSNINNNIRYEDFKSLAIYFETQKNNLLAGKYYYYSKNYQKAIKHLLKSAKLTTNDNDDNDEAITLAIDTVASSNDDKLTNQVIDYLLGNDGDELPKDPKYLFRLYMARKQYNEASKTAIIIANEEQINGNYRNAHDVLFGMYQELKKNHIKIPTEMINNIRLLHSYILVRLHVKRNDHLRGARMLIRVANNISKFPSHIVPILTSTVIECHRAGLKFAAFNFAAMLMRPEYRMQVDAKYSKKIEAIVRKPPRNKDHNIEDEPLTSCPYCQNNIPETEITCDKCKNTIPFCIASGRHIVADDFTVCPHCDFPAIKSEFLRIIETEENCPMCNQQLDAKIIPQNINIRPYLYFQDDKK